MGNFFNIFKSLRQASGYTQQELADKLGISRSRIGMYETGAREPDFETLEIIADFFNVSTDYLLGRQTPQETAPALLDVTGLTPEQLEHIQFIVDDLRNSDI